jgi:hypothetical protein
LGSRSNAIEELTRFWLQARHGCLVDESIPVPVPYALSDIDLVAVRADSKKIKLPGPDGAEIGPRIIVETKDEHDWEPTGKEFGALLGNDIEKMGDAPFIPRGTKGVKFTMLRQEHFEKASEYFDSPDFDRLFVVHAVDPCVANTHASVLTRQRIHILSVNDLVADLHVWYVQHPRKSGLRHTLVGDLWHLLVGFCGCSPHGRDAL